MLVAARVLKVQLLNSVVLFQKVAQTRHLLRKGILIQRQFLNRDVGSQSFKDVERCLVIDVVAVVVELFEFEMAVVSIEERKQLFGCVMPKLIVG